eukprot:6959942-Alexandrium_andersonii.AAC.1
MQFLEGTCPCSSRSATTAVAFTCRPDDPDDGPAPPGRWRGIIAGKRGLTRGMSQRGSLP